MSRGSGTSRVVPLPASIPRTAPGFPGGEEDTTGCLPVEHVAGAHRLMALRGARRLGSDRSVPARRWPASSPAWTRGTRRASHDMAASSPWNRIAERGGGGRAELPGLPGPGDLHPRAPHGAPPGPPARGRDRLQRGAAGPEAGGAGADRGAGDRAPAPVHFQGDGLPPPGGRERAVQRDRGAADLRDAPRDDQALAVPAGGGALRAVWRGAERGGAGVPGDGELGGLPVAGIPVEERRGPRRPCATPAAGPPQASSSAAAR
jgi:hypothetical protein